MSLSVLEAFLSTEHKIFDADWTWQYLILTWDGRPRSQMKRQRRCLPRSIYRFWFYFIFFLWTLPTNVNNWTIENSFHSAFQVKSAVVSMPSYLIWDSLIIRFIWRRWITPHGSWIFNLKATVVVVSTFQNSISHFLTSSSTSRSRSL